MSWPLHNEIWHDARTLNGRFDVLIGKEPVFGNQRRRDTGRMRPKYVRVQAVADHHDAGPVNRAQTSEGDIEDILEGFAKELGQDTGSVRQPMREVTGFC